MVELGGGGVRMGGFNGDGRFFSGCDEGKWNRR